MANTPKSVKVGIELLSPNQVERLVEEAEERGRALGREEIIDWLQVQYIDKAPVRGGVEAEAILKVAKNAAAYLRKLNKKGKK